MGCVSTGVWELTRGAGVDVHMDSKVAWTIEAS